jgi:hypothetical protein
MRSATEQSAKEPTSRAAGRGDRGDKRVDVEVNKRRLSARRKLNREEDLQEQQGRSTTTTTYQRSRWTTPRESLGSRGISTMEQREP